MCIRDSFKTAMLLLGEVRSEPITMHAELIRSFSKACGPGCWSIIYTADVRMRCGHMERNQRRLQSEMPSRYDPLHPSGAIFQQASSLSDVETQAFWACE
eukprot:675157-Alexandrium_andersonii.AAC.1